MKAIPESFNMVWLVKKILRLPLRFHFLADRTWIKRSSVWFGNSICCPSCTYNKEQIGDDMFIRSMILRWIWDNLYELAGKKGRFNLFGKTADCLPRPCGGDDESLHRGQPAPGG